MTTIKWNGGIPSFSTADTQATTASGGVSAGVRLQTSGNTLSRQRAALTSALDAALARLQERIAAVSWPASPVRSARSAFTTANPSDLAASAANGASIGAHSVRVESAVRPSAYATAGFDPNAATTLAPGTYTLGYAWGPTSAGTSSAGESGQVTITVSSGETWGEVLARMARTFGSASMSLAAQLVPARRVWYSDDGERRSLVDAQGLAIGPAGAREGWRLSLSGADAASKAMLKTLGLDTTAWPGSDARASIDGVAQTSATGRFSLDNGRVTLDARGTLGAAETLRVVPAASALADALAGVLDAYNEVRGLLGSSLVRAGQARDWESVASSRAEGLESVGVERSAGGALWLDEERFLTALFSRPEEARALLADSGGLLPELAERAARAQGSGTQGILDGAQLAKDEDPALAVFRARHETERARAGALLDLVDGAAGIKKSSIDGKMDIAGWTGVLHVKG